MNENLQNLTTYLAVSDTLIDQGTKEEVADAARLLALRVGHYRQRYGVVSI